MNEVAWTAISAVATALAFVAVAWQSILTRRALAIAQTAALDTARARLDNGAPAVTVRLEAPIWPPLAGTAHGMPCNPWPRGHNFHFPNQEWEPTVLQAVAVVENLSGRRVEVRFDGDLIEDQDNRPVPATTPVLVPAQNSATGASGEHRVYLQRSFSAKQLAENYEARKAGRELPHRVTGSITVHDDRDNGVEDTWSLTLTGCPLQPHENLGSVWVTVPHHITEGTGLRSLQYDLLPPRRRTYWVSRRGGVELGEPRTAA
ncbi:hypothetical protein J7E93_06505 [Streptomyces sp. ISL-36]|uniref:hypothetical protein n=1 Tax=Streptomyces sp. ISL-36 TaxID=2819182 RepID=UPI001BE8623B|nr:hypothetical protein [Streptomyces sp. ISL-36]MBT2439777.1 hypothetical protein [Streptomyces sp. ISL-36]